MLQSFYERFVNAPFYFYLLTAAFFVISTLIGFHPLVGLSIFAAIIQSVIHELSVVPLTVVAFAITYLAGTILVAWVLDVLI